MTHANRGFFGIGIYNAKTEANMGTLFRSAQSFGASFVFTIGKRYTHQVTDTGKSTRHIPTYSYHDIDDFIDHLPSKCTVVGIELDDCARSLQTFVHPERACYLLGAEDTGLPDEVLMRCHIVTKIPYASRCLNVAVAGSIVIYDRVAKAPSRNHRKVMCV